MAGRLLIAPDPDYVERAFNPAKYGELPTAPTIEMVLSEVGDAKVLSAVVHFVPYAPEGGWTETTRAALEATILDTIEAYVPGLRDLVQASQLLTPTDIEEMTGAPGGHWHHAEMGIDQILTVRPVNQMAHYRFGVPGLYLCGAAAHPGGDVTGVPGRNSAMQLLKDGVLK